MKKIYLIFSIITLMMAWLPSKATEVKVTTNMPETIVSFSLNSNGSDYLYYTWENGSLEINLAADRILCFSVNNKYVATVTMDGKEYHENYGLYQISEQEIASVVANGGTPLIEIIVSERPEMYAIVKGDKKMFSLSYGYMPIPDSQWTGDRVRVDLDLPNEALVITANTNYALKAVIANGVNELPEAGASRFAITSDLFNPGENEFEVEAYNLDDIRSESFTVNVKDGTADDILVYRYGFYDPLPTSALANPIKFNPLTELPITFTHSGYGKTLYKVEVDGEEIPRNREGGFSIYDLPDNAVVTVTVNYPEIEIPVRFNFTNPDTEGAIKEVMDNNFRIIPSSKWQADDFTMPFGSTLRIVLNYDDFDVNATVNSSGNYTEYLEINIDREEPYEIVVTAEPKNPYEISILYGNLPAHFYILLGREEEKIEMTENDWMDLTVKRNDNRLEFVAEEGWSIIGVYVDGEECPLVSYVDGDHMYEVYMESFERDRKAVVFFSSSTIWRDKCILLSYGLEGREKAIYPENPYTIVEYNAEELPFSVEALPIDQSVPVCFINNMEVSYNPQYPSQSEGFDTLADDAVIKFFGLKPASFTLSFSVEEGLSPIVTTDLLTVISTEEELSVLEETLVTIKPETGTSLLVNLNGSAIEPGSDGSTTFIVNCDSSVEISKGNNVGTDIISYDSDTTDVYSMQGILLKRNVTASHLKNFPAGLYIIGGRKTIINH